MEREFKGLRQQGFTWVEIMVAVAICAGLAAIVVPNLGKIISGIQETKAKEDCELIAQAIERFYRDVGIWPTFGANGMPNEIYGLTSASTVDTADPYGYVSGRKASLWLTGGTDNFGYADNMANHLFTNSPGGQTSYTYPTSSSTSAINGYYWRGPYLPQTMKDPWGHPYIITLNAPTAYRVDSGTDELTSYCRWVISAGPNGMVDTNWHPTAQSNQRRNNLGGDDIGARIDLVVF